jgi:hypothetical protein
LRAQNSPSRNPRAALNADPKAGAWCDYNVVAVKHKTKKILQVR